MQVDITEVKKLAQSLKNVTDPRRAWGNKRHRLEDILTIGLCALAHGTNDFTGMEAFGREREAQLRESLDLPNGIPNADTFERVFDRIDLRELSAAVQAWLER